ncbi:ATP-dependent DNA helicase RecG [soil metagenome]
MDIKFLKGIGDKRAEAFEKLEIRSISDFKNFIPRSYLQKININNIKDNKGKNVLIIGRVADVVYPRKSSHPTKVTVRDASGFAEIPVFGRSEFGAKKFLLNEIYIFSGKIPENYYYSINHIDYRDHLKINENDKNDVDFLKYSIYPVYELSGHLKKTWVKPLLLTKILFNAFRYLVKNEPETFSETIPEYLLEAESQFSRRDAILRINFPHKPEDIEKARRRLSYEELFYMEIIIALKKYMTRHETKGIKFDKPAKYFNDSFKNILDFELTASQKKVINEIYADMHSSVVMNRLLQGDVGSGKTIVSLYSIMLAVFNGYQSAFMCPTEILAEQHFNTVNSYIEKYNSLPGIEKKMTVVLLTGRKKSNLKSQTLAEIESGRADIIIGTHALIQDVVKYNNLGFVVIDEQHKFGVMQRAKIKEKGLNPDVLVMTATPIPRTLALTVYGDLDVSIIDEIPGNRKPVKTVLRKEDDKENVYKFIREKINEGRQIYIVYPIIDESEKLDLRSAEQGFQLLSKHFFNDLKVELLHGRMTSEDKEGVMKRFKEKKTDILVSTTVIEVGIDIPNATVMIIEEAQRFGISQLHQLRGRVGRSDEQSFCILIANVKEETEEGISMKRLSILCDTNDGFKLAEADMEIRGPGEFFGLRQSGILNFTSTDLVKDKDILIKVRNTAFDIIEEDPQLRKQENQIIRNYITNNLDESLKLLQTA